MGQGSRKSNLLTAARQLLPARWRFPHVRPVGQVRAMLGENPRWDAESGVVYWIDIPAGLLHGTRLVDGSTTTLSLGAEVGALALTGDGRAIVALGDRLVHVALDSGAQEDWCRLPDLDPTRVRANDCAWTPDGDLLIVTMDRAGRLPLGRLYRVSPDGRAEVFPGNYVIGNGPAVDSERRVIYVADSPRREIHLLPLNAPSQQRLFAHVKGMGDPDGMLVDTDGTLLVARYDGSCLTRFGLSGAWIEDIALPVSRPTAVEFVNDGHRIAVTSARDARAKGGEILLVNLPK